MLVNQCEAESFQDLMFEENLADVAQYLWCAITLEDFLRIGDIW